MPPYRMTVAEFLDWNPGGGHWQLRDGEPEMMAPPSEAHGAIQSELGRLLGNHLLAQQLPCRVIGAPGVVPRWRSDYNMLNPDLGITYKPPSGSHAMPEPLVLIEILSPPNETETRANVWAYFTIPSLAEIVLIGSVRMGAEVLRRGADGQWPARPEFIGTDGDLRLESIGYAAPLRDAYRTSGLI